MSGQKGLGKGLADLMQEDTLAMNGMSVLAQKSGAAVKYLPIGNIEPNPYQPRRHFDEKEMEDLTNSVSVKGVLQPILVRRKRGTDNLFEIIAGERRWRAATAANFTEIPVIIKNFSDKEVLEVALIENLQREDMNAIDEAVGIQRLIEEFGYSHGQVGTRIGKSRSYVSNLLRVLTLPQSVQEKVQAGDISMSHARTLIGSDNIEELAEKIAAGNLAVRDVEQMTRVEKEVKAPSTASKQKTEKSPTAYVYEEQFQKIFGAPVDISIGSRGNGKLTLKFKNLEQLDKLASTLMNDKGE